MFERYTERARRVLFFARYEASQLGSISIDTEHLLLGLIREGKGLTNRIFARAHVSLEDIRRDVEGQVTFRQKVSTSVEIPFSAECKRALEFAAQESDRLLHDYIGTEHLLLGLLRADKSLAASILTARGLRLDRVREEILTLLNGRTSGDDDTAMTAAVPGEGPARRDVPAFIRSPVVHIIHSRKGRSIRSTNRDFIALGCTLREAIAVGWDVVENRVEVPPMLEGGNYDFVLMLPHDEPIAGLLERLRSAIQEQFGIAVSREKRMREAVVIAAPAGPGPALRAHPGTDGGNASMYVGFSTVAESAPPSMPSFPVHDFKIAGMPFDLVCRSLEDVLGQPLVDETGLTGIYDLTLTGTAIDRRAFITALRDQAGLVVTPAQREIEMVVAQPR
jgi:uncharacterized protein (TIGR03435 family)